jgi:hypothetical protein
MVSTLSAIPKFTSAALLGFSMNANSNSLSNLLIFFSSYEYFANKQQQKQASSSSCASSSVKWRNAVRHNLSSHKYFVKTLEKNAKGHFWYDFLNILKIKQFDFVNLI